MERNHLEYILYINRCYTVMKSKKHSFFRQKIIIIKTKLSNIDMLKTENFQIYIIMLFSTCILLEF